MAPCRTRAAAMFQYVVTMRYGALDLPRYIVRISSALAGVNCPRNQARAFRMTGSRRRSYSLSSRSALSYLVVTGGSVIAVARKLRGLFPGGDPGPPGLLRRAHGELRLVADQRHAEQQRLEGQLFEPAVVGQQRCPEAQLRKAPGVAVDERAYAELLGEAPQLAGRGGALVQIDEVGLDPALGEEAQRGAGVGALADPEDLDFHLAPGRESHGAELYEPLQRRLEGSHGEPGPGGELLERLFPVGELYHGGNPGVAPRHGHASV